MAAFVPPATVHRFLADAKPREYLVYATGFELPAFCPATIGIVRNAYNDGEIDLVQRRRPDGQLDYLAQKRAHRARIEGCFRFPPEMTSRGNSKGI